MRKWILCCLLMIGVSLFVSCASQKWTDVSNSVDMDSVMQKFPALYDQYKSGELIVSKVEQGKDKDGKVRYRVTHKDKTTDDLDEWLLWQTVYINN